MSQYPVSRLISEAMTARGLSKRQLAPLLGYRKGDTCALAMTAVLKQGQIARYPLIHPTIAEVLGIPRDEYDRAVRETEVILVHEAEERKRRAEAERRRNFRPFVYVHTAGERSALAGFIGGKTIGFIEDLSTLPLAEQLDRVRTAIARHHARYLPESRIPCWGVITGYRYRTEYDGGAIELNAQGEVLRFSASEQPEVHCWASIGNKTFKFGD